MKIVAQFIGPAHAPDGKAGYAFKLPEPIRHPIFNYTGDVLVKRFEDVYLLPLSVNLNEWWYVAKSMPGAYAGEHVDFQIGTTITIKSTCEGTEGWEKRTRRLLDEGLAAIFS